MSHDVGRQVRSRVRRLTGVQVVATGSYAPDRVVRNEDLAELGYDADWIIQRTGIRERRFAPDHMATCDLAVNAAERCLATAGVRREDVDLLIVGTFTPDWLVPSAACLVQERMNLDSPAFDVQAACSGFMYSLVTGMQFVAAGTAKLALVIGADTNSRIVDPSDRKTYPLFGDGAGAVLLSPGSASQGLLSYALGSDGSGAELLYRKLGGSRVPLTCEYVQKNEHYLHMDGRPVFKWAVRLIEDSINQVLAAAETPASEVSLYVLHQANIRIIDAAAEALGICREKLVVNLDRYGNTSAGSIPLALDEAVQQGRVKRGDKIVLCGFGAGLAWGTTLLRW
ncbi:MAG: beta-ketoacyl-ACP synthase III [Pirellulales bacterium]